MEIVLYQDDVACTVLVNHFSSYFTLPASFVDIYVIFYEYIESIVQTVLPV